METACNLVGSLPPDLYEYFLNNIIEKLFSKTELIRFLLLNPQYGNYISIHNLTITIVNQFYLKFGDDVLSNDMIKLSDIIFENLNSFKNLFENHILSIETLIVHYTIQDLNFLSKYAKNIQFESLTSLNVSLINNDNFKLNNLKMMNLSFYKNYFGEFDNFIENINFLSSSFTNIQYNLNFIISDHYDFKETINIIHYCKNKLKTKSGSDFKFNFKFSILFCLTLNFQDVENSNLPKLIQHFDYCLQLLERYKIKNDDIKIVLKFILNDSKIMTSSEFKLYELCEFIGFKFVNKLIIDSIDDNHYNYNFKPTKLLTRFNNLKLIEIKCDEECNYANFGDLSSLKKLKKLVFNCNNVDYSWLSTSLPKNLETIRLFQNMKTKPKNIFRIPKNLKNLIIETDDSSTKIDFRYFQFDNDINLEKIIILNYFVKKSIIRITNLFKLPKSLKEFRFHDSNDFINSLSENYFIFDSKFDNSTMDGVYTNIDVQFNNVKCCCICNYSFRMLNLKSKRIENTKK